MARTLTARVTGLRARSGFLDVLWRTVDEARIDGERRLAAEITYYTFFSLFPLLMVFVTFLDAIFDAQDEPGHRQLGARPVPGDQHGHRGQHREPEGPGVRRRHRHRARAWAGSHAFESFEHAILVVWKGPAVAPMGLVKSRLRAFILMGILGARSS